MWRASSPSSVDRRLGEPVLDVVPPRWLRYVLASLHVVGLVIVISDALALSDHETLLRASVFGGCVGAVYALNDLRLTVYPSGVAVCRNPLLVRTFSLADIDAIGIRQNAIAVRIHQWAIGFTISATNGPLRFGRSTQAEQALTTLERLRASLAGASHDSAPERVFKWSWGPRVVAGALLYVALAEVFLHVL